MGVGYYLHAVQMINDEYINQSNRLIFNVALPLLLIYEVGKADFMALIFISSLAPFLPSQLYLSSVIFLPDGISILLRNRGIYAGSFGKPAIVGLSVVMSAYGREGLARAGMLMGFIVPVLNFTPSWHCCIRTASRRNEIFVLDSANLPESADCCVLYRDFVESVSNSISCGCGCLAGPHQPSDSASGAHRNWAGFPLAAFKPIGYTSAWLRSSS